MLFFNANLICYYFYPTKKREEPNKSIEKAMGKNHAAFGKKPGDPKETGWRDASEETLPFVSCAFYC